MTRKASILGLQLSAIGVLAVLAAPWTVAQATEENSVSQLSQVPRPATTVKEWMAQVEAATVRVTGVRVEPAAGTIRVILDTSAGISAVPTRRSEGNTLITELEGAVLALPEGNRVAIDKPGEGISAIEVIQATPTAVQVRITGETAVPVVEVVPSAAGLVLSAEADEDVAEEEITVTGEGQQGYRVPNASTATRTDTPIRDIPQSIQVVPQEVLRDRNVRTVTEAVETVSGVSENFYFYTPLAGSRVIRGFSQFGNFRNGFREGPFASSLAVPDAIEQVEVLKGPASVLFGDVEPGGIINIVTKQPLSEPYRKLAFEAGNSGLYKPSIDLSGPLTADRNVLYRLIAAYENAGSYQDFANSETTIIAPSITLKLGDRTTLNLYYEFSRFFGDPPTYDVPLLSDGSLPPRSFLPNYPSLLLVDLESQKFGYSLNHKFDDNWQIRNNLAITLIDNMRQEPFIASVVDDRFLTGFQFFGDETTESNYFGQIDLVGKFKTGSIAHQLVIGFDFNRFNTRSESLTNTSPNLPDLDIFNPIYDVTRPDLPADSLSVFEQRTQAYGIYLQDQIAFSDTLKLLIGGRYDWISNESGSGDNNPEQNDGAFSPRIGTVYQPSKNVSLYASYSRSFAPTTGRNVDDTPFEPTKGTQYEIGVKANFLDGRLSTTLSAYNLTRSNVTTPASDPALAVRGFQVQVGEQRSRGIELDVAGELLPGWKIIGSYALTDATVTVDNSIPVGNRLKNVPQNQASLWTTYEIQKGNLKGFGFGLGLFYVGERQVDLANSATIGSYLRTDAALYYRRGGFNAAINVRNLFDLDYVSSANFAPLYVKRGNPLTIVGSISWEF
ncbi:TonB-dependent siderophore receptor [Phormidesmis sp. 146-12]